MTDKTLSERLSNAAIRDRMRHQAHLEPRTTDKTLSERARSQAKLYSKERGDEWHAAATEDLFNELADALDARDALLAQAAAALVAVYSEAALTGQLNGIVEKALSAIRKEEIT